MIHMHSHWAGDVQVARCRKPVAQIDSPDSIFRGSAVRMIARTKPDTVCKTCLEAAELAANPPGRLRVPATSTAGAGREHETEALIENARFLLEGGLELAQVAARLDVPFENLRKRFERYGIPYVGGGE